MTKKKLSLAAIVSGMALIALPLASASQNDVKLSIGFHMQLTGPNSAAGTFQVVSDQVNGHGAVSATFTLTPHGAPNDARLAGTQTFAVAETGCVITTHFRGFASGADPVHQAGRGTFELAGSGACADLRGHGTFLVVVDLGTGAVTGTYDGQAN
jgi:hypothetical protein